MTNWIKELQSKGKKKYSQGNQDGFIEWIFKNIGTTNKFCVEFGFNSKEIIGGSGANTARLVLEENWTPLYLDGNYENLDINLHKEYLTPNNIGQIFKKYSVPEEADYISIDVDSIDLWLLKSILDNKYRPRLISVEYNINFPITISVTVEKNTKWMATDAVYGASLLALNNVAIEHNYFLVCVEPYLDLFFIRGDLIEKEQIPILEEFTKYTNKRHHKIPTAERINKFVEYPSMKLLDCTPWISEIKHE
jgi:hypothetical protein